MILFERFPALAERVPWRPLGRFPTPLEPAPALGLGDDVWVKRDDLSGEPGGNKVRKLEFLLGKAVAEGRRRVLTVGASGSNHVIATGVYARAAGLGVDALLFPQPHTDDVARKLALHERLGIQAIRVPGQPLRLLAWLARSAVRGLPMYIPAGGSSPVGALGFVEAALELGRQVAAGAPAPDLIYAPLGSGGTVAGLLVGLGLARLSARVVAVRVVSRRLVPERAVLRLAARTARLLGLPAPEARLEIVDDQIGPGYGASTPAAEAALARARAAGLPVDGTYSAKALAALYADQAAGRLRGRRVLFWCTFAPYERASEAGRSR